MQKEFDNWNGLKKQIDGKKFTPLFSEKEIWWCSVGVNVGREEDGKNELYERPVLIFKKINKESFVGLPLNSQVKENDYYFKYFFNDKERIIKINQIKTFAGERLIRRMGKMSEDEFLKLAEQVNKVLLHKDETPFLHGVSQAPFGVSKESITPVQNLSSSVLYFRVISDSVGIYECVDKLCSKEDVRRAGKPDGSWLKKEGVNFPGGISYFTELGFKKYRESGLFDWHKSIVRNYEIKVLDYEPQNILYRDENQIILNKN